MAQQENTEKCFSAEDLMELWQCGRATVYQQLRSGHPRAFRLGRLWRVSASALEEFTKGQRGVAKSGANLRKR